jgi:hypothetical protein
MDLANTSAATSVYGDEEVVLDARDWQELVELKSMHDTKHSKLLFEEIISVAKGPLLPSYEEAGQSFSNANANPGSNSA